jgi:hypothetical protein
MAVIVTDSAISIKPLKKNYKWIIKKGRAILPHPCARKRKGDHSCFKRIILIGKKNKNNYVYTKYCRRGFFLGLLMGQKQRCAHVNFNSPITSSDDMAEKPFAVNCVTKV